MTRSAKKPHLFPTGDLATDRALADINRSLDDLSQSPGSGSIVVMGVALVDGVVNHINHGMGQAFQGWWITDLTGPASTGRIERVISASCDMTKQLWLKATGWGATITVSVMVF